MNITNLLNKREYDFIFNSHQIDNHGENTTSRLRFWYEHIKEFSHDDSHGDIFEFGVFRGASLISVAILLKRLGSKKQVYGFDTFGGFPNYDPEDSLDSFENYRNIYFDEAMIENYKILKKIRRNKIDTEVDMKNISSEGEFEDTSIEDIKKKIEYFELDNIQLVQGSFNETLEGFFQDYKGNISSANIDCDLYGGYKTCLPFVWKNLSKDGFVHLDEYYSLKFPGARIACEEFFEENNLRPTKMNTPDAEFERWALIK